MPAETPARRRVSFDFKRTTFPLFSFVLRTADLVRLENELQARLGDTPDFFDQDLLVVNLSALRDEDSSIDFRALIGLLRRYRVQPIGVHGGSPSQMQAAADAGLVAAPEVSAAQSIARTARTMTADPAAGAATAAQPAVESAGRGDAVSPGGANGSVTDTGAGDTASPDGAGGSEGVASTTDAAAADVAAASEVAASEAAVASAAARAAAPAGSAPVPVGAVVIDKPLRSGQRVYARGTDLVVLEAVSFGAEVFADGNIHVYAPLRGRAVAGARGKADARIFSTCMEPQLVAIAGVYRTIEIPLPPEVAGKPAQVRLVGASLIIEPL